MKKAIDLFAGSGGFTEGAQQAGVKVVWAANHWPKAVACHAANHADVSHACQDLHQADWSKVPACNLVLASPCCQGHAKARGTDRPHHDASRSTAWAVVSCCEYHRPEAFIVENVPEFLGWSLYPAWELAMQRLGYKLQTLTIDAADVGVPQHRLRLFVVGRFMKAPRIAQPKAAKHRAVRGILDFDSGPWGPIHKPGRSAATLRRVANGRAQFGKQFVMPYYGSGSGLTGRSLDRPLGTVTTRDRWALVDGDQMRMLTVAEYRRAMGFPDGYDLPATRSEAIHLLGNAVPPPLAKYVISQVL
jgi:DNA (cytosine-5)-methyltransferase 1